MAVRRGWRLRPAARGRGGGSARRGSGDALGAKPPGRRAPAARPRSSTSRTRSTRPRGSSERTCSRPSSRPWPTQATALLAHRAPRAARAAAARAAPGDRARAGEVVARNGLRQVEAARARAAQGGEVRAGPEPLAQVARERPDVGARASSARRARASSPRTRHELDRVDRDGRGRAGAPPRRAAPARRAAGPPTCFAEKAGGTWSKRRPRARASAAAQLARASTSTGARRAERLARQVVGRGREAEPHRGAVDLLARGQEAREPRGLADADAAARRSRRDRACRCGPTRRVAERPPHPVHDVVGRGPGRLVDDEDAVHAAAYSSPRRPRLVVVVRARRGLGALPVLLEQLRHAVGGVEPLVVVEVELGRVAHAEPLAELAADEAARPAASAGEALLALRLVAEDAHVARARSAGRGSARRGSRSRSRCAGP